jgi:Ca2+:H+ antiporter
VLRDFLVHDIRSEWWSALFIVCRYLAWPFGKYVEGDLDDSTLPGDEEQDNDPQHRSEASDMHTIQGIDVQQATFIPSAGSVPLSDHPTITPGTYRAERAQSVSWNAVPSPTNEATSLLASANTRDGPIRSYGASPFGAGKESSGDSRLGETCFWLAFFCVIGPLMLIVCVVCWGLVITVPMAKLNWALIHHLFRHPTRIRFCAAPPAVIVPTPPTHELSSSETDGLSPQAFSIKHPRLLAGQTAPSSPTSTILLCTYRAVGWQYYKYTLGGINILFVNLLPVVIFAIFDGLWLLPVIERRHRAGHHIPLILLIITSRTLIFLMSLVRGIPLSYFIGIAVASISAQSSIGMGAVINATFGSVIEVILYAIALPQGKGHLVEGSIVGSLLAGVLLMPGASMCSGALRKKNRNSMQRVQE